MRAIRWVTAIVVVAIPLAACSESTSNDAPKVQLLENSPTLKHFGKTYAEWAVAWWNWYYTMPAEGGQCRSPVADTTGELCGLNQSGDAFFLAGTSGGNALRTKCVVPRGKMIVLPILNFASDNGGEPPAEHLDDATLISGVRNAVDDMTELLLKIDGAVIDTARLRVEPTRFSYTLGPEPNVYTCQGAPGVTGLVDPSFAGGYYALIAPPPAGPHEIEFAGRQKEFQLHVTYQLRVE